MLLTAAVLLSSPPAFAQEPQRPAAAEGFGLGLFVRPALDGSDPWLVTGFRLSIPATPRISIDCESAAIQGAQNEFSRIHGLFGVQLRFLKSPDASDRQSRYWIAGIQAMPGDELREDGSIRERRLYTAAVLGIGSRQLVGRATRVLTEAAISGGDGFGVSVTLGVQFGRHRNRPGS